MDEKISRRELNSIIEHAYRENSKSLSLRRYGLREIPPEIGMLTNLQELYLV